MKLEAGMYVRTNYRKEVVIRKIVKIYENEFKDHALIFDKLTRYNYYAEDKLFIPSKDIVDLIQKGDYVNGELVEDITGEYLKVNGQLHNKYYFNKQIKSIVTKEQFEAMEYKLD